MQHAMNFVPAHIGAGKDEVAADQPGGRVFLLPGSAHRAARIADRFDERREYPSDRGHTVFVGRVNGAEVGCVSSGMGCPSLGIVATELVQSGVRRLLRVGSAGGLGPAVQVGHIVVATGAVRDEHASDAFAPLEFPAVAGFQATRALVGAARARLDAQAVHVGLLHSKDSLHGREFALGPRSEENARYMELLARLGCVGSEMEASHLFVLAHGLRGLAHDVPADEAPIEAGALCAILGAMAGDSDAESRRRAEETAIEIALDGATRLAGGAA